MVGLYFVKKENFYPNLALKHVTHSLPSAGIINLYVYSSAESLGAVSILEFQMFGLGLEEVNI
ncbi:hypothetical protein ASL14_15065 [Paenibacillus sp. IHB B 3084]|uniref:Uncharacterized protein n=1 Tax=Paenibacillus terrae TaxID=159743 RepID=A0A0D7X1F8_9BACL|nr:hypothetical protein ASL14_15065 [Paenibacillus sp. IHB B 3084]KJD44783.1 hypothetical protein QD47_14985 [Paenibacillus terrae]